MTAARREVGRGDHAHRREGLPDDRLAEKAGPKTINDEVLLLLRLCGDQGDLIRATLRREKALKLALPLARRPYSADEKARMLEEAQKLRTPEDVRRPRAGSELRAAR